MQNLKRIFNNANIRFLENEIKLIKSNVKETCLCSSLKTYIERELKKEKLYPNYYVDVEYNRNAGRAKTIIDNEENIFNITCDLIIHSRGENEKKDNLLALEMKKSYRPYADKEKDRMRLKALTKSKSTDEVWLYDGNTLPRHVCGYSLGIYYEIDLNKEVFYIEYYANGKKVEQYQKSLNM